MFFAEIHFSLDHSDGEGDGHFRKSALTITCLFRSDDLHPGLRKGVPLFRDSLEMYVRLVVSFVKTARQAIKQNSALNAQTFFTVNRLSVSAFKVLPQGRALEHLRTREKRRLLNAWCGCLD